ncbi:hypothetical protein sscle_11g081920 [Sclerotinia sclerotiorum 1980 UF-70]|uniref:NYN domain-containing protein n=1 Tax=Sclerotinia sclerotiorum (strain ATCC 18683 / 1980 / Ss-1) TaxID=665079 RepID=A0A1D9QF58_SCLS1|nr:hypothetical protein sscle_11g081920 [Sclerotinia sclerotiorum 1980 UF-70]
MIEPQTSQPWDLTSAIDLFNRLSVSTSGTDFPPSNCTVNDEPSNTDGSARALGDFRPIWNYLGVDAEKTSTDFDVGSFESAPSSFTSGGLFSDLDSPPTSATDDSDIPDVYEAYVTKSKEVRWKDEVNGTKLPKLRHRSKKEKSLENVVSFPKENLEEQLSQLKTDSGSPFAADRLFDIQSPRPLEKRQTRRQVLSDISQTDESSGVESEVERPSASKSARLFGYSSAVGAKKSYESLTIHPLYNLTLEEKRAKIAKKLSDQLGIDKKTLLNATANLQRSNEPKAIHVFVDCSNIMIGFHQALKIARGIPEEAKMKQQPFSYQSLAFIMERNRPAAKRILAGSRSSHSDLPVHFAEAEKCGYETNILDRVLKVRESTPKKVRRGLGNGYLTGRSNGSESPSTNMSSVSFVEQGVDELLHMKILETLNDYPKPSTIVLASGDGAEAEYSAGFFKNVQRALEKGWNVELVAWNSGLSGEYRESSFKQRWRKQFRVIRLDDFSEELLAIYRKHETSP